MYGEMYGRSNLEELSVSSLEKPKNLHQKRYSAYKVYFPKEKMERRLSLDSQMSIDLARTTQSFKRPKTPGGRAKQFISFLAQGNMQSWGLGLGVCDLVIKANCLVILAVIYFQFSEYFPETYNILIMEKYGMIFKSILISPTETLLIFLLFVFAQVCVLALCVLGLLKQNERYLSPYLITVLIRILFIISLIYLTSSSRDFEGWYIECGLSVLMLFVNIFILVVFVRLFCIYRKRRIAISPNALNESGGKVLLNKLYGYAVY